MKRLIAFLGALSLVVAACGGDDAGETTTSTTGDDPTTEADTGDAPPMEPAEVVFEAQQSDGSVVVVASVTLPAPGFIAVHGNADGAPGAVIGNTSLLPAGTTTDVTVTLDSPLDSTAMVFPMAHIDVNENGEYEFSPPDVTVDGPARTADGDVAVVGAEVTVDG